jgi:hypothetical protein
MIQEEDSRDAYVQPLAPLLGEGVLHNGVEGAAAHRAHMRGLTMARQAAERRFGQPAAQAGLDRPARLAARRERAEELRVELERIDAEHRSWLHEQGVHVPEGRSRKR